METWYARTELLLGENSSTILSNARVAVFGIGGVGGYVCEGLVRSGIGAFDLTDRDTVSLTNLNRQIIATRKTIGQSKTQAMKERMLDINPAVIVHTNDCFFLPENADDFPFDSYDYIIDAVDTVTAKIELIMQAQKHRIPVISAMGAGNKLDPSLFRASDLSSTKVCPLARVMRRELKKRGITHLKVVYSEEEPIQPACEENSTEILSSESKTFHKTTPGSVPFVPSAAGMLIAAEVVKDLLLPPRDRLKNCVPH